MDKQRRTVEQINATNLPGYRDLIPGDDLVMTCGSRESEAT
jgi:hypothetical protein